MRLRGGEGCMEGQVTNLVIANGGHGLIGKQDLRDKRDTERWLESSGSVDTSVCWCRRETAMMRATGIFAPGLADGAAPRST